MGEFAILLIEELGGKSIIIILFINTIFFPIFAWILTIHKISKSIEKLERSILTLIKIEIKKSNEEDNIKSLLKKDISEVFSD